MRLLLLALLLICSRCLTAAPAAVWECGGQGELFPVAAADGRYDETLLNGRPCIMNSGFADKLYFSALPEVRKSLPEELWIVVRGQSDVPGQMVLRYNARTEPYKYSDSVRLLMGKPDTLVFRLPDAAIAGSQNGGADFRIETYRFRLTELEIHTRKPDVPALSPAEREAETEAQIAALPAGSLPAEDPMEFIVCGDDGFGRQAREQRQLQVFRV